MTVDRGILEASDCAPTASHAISVEAATDIAAVLKALADPLRLRMLSAIATDPRGESCVCDLAELAELSQPTISHHLKKLKETGLLASERRGTWVYYRITPERRSAVTALLDSFGPAVITEFPRAAANEASGSEQLRITDARVTRLAEELAGELTTLNRDLVIAIVRESYTALIKSAKLTAHMVPLIEKFARQRLADLTRDRTKGPAQVLFVCVANAGRSQLAAAMVNQLSGGAIIARSAGSTPALDVHPHVRTVLNDISGGTNTAAEYPKPLTDDAVRASDVVVTMGCGDICPIIDGVRYEDWIVGDPALASPAGVEAIRRDIEGRVRGLIESLSTPQAN